MKLALITAKFPYTAEESFLAAEVAELARQVQMLAIYPTRSDDANDRFARPDVLCIRWPLLSTKVIRLALQQFWSAPGRCVHALRTIVMRSRNLKILVKNLVVYAKGLAVARDLFERGLDHVHAYWLSTPSTVALVASIAAGIGWSCTGHRWDIYEDNLLRVKTRSAKFVRVISAREQAALVRRAGLDYAAKVRLLHLGVEVNSVVAPSDARPTGAPTFLCAAHLLPVKGHRYLLEALRIVLDRGCSCRCVLAGDGPLGHEIRTAIRRLGLDSAVTLVGVVPHEQLLNQLASGTYTAAVLASIEESDGAHEGIPAFLMEAMAAAVPCIATRTGSMGELIDSSCGLLVEQRDPRGLADAISDLASDRKLRDRLGAGARRRIADSFDARATAEILATWCEESIDSVDARGQGCQ